MDHTKKFPFLLVFAFLFVLGVVLGYGYYTSQENAIEDQMQTLDKEIAEINNQLDELKESDTVSAQTATQALDTIALTEVEWSEVLSKILKIAPQDLVEKRALVEFTSYSGSEGGRLTLNTRTYPSRDVRNLLNAVAKTIRAFNENPDFSDAFVPSISKSVSDDNETVLSFILSVAYNPSYADLTEEEEAPSVARR
jgi:hypothetical protein